MLKCINFRSPLTTRREQVTVTFSGITKEES